MTQDKKTAVLFSEKGFEDWKNTIEKQAEQRVLKRFLDVLENNVKNRLLIEKIKKELKEGDE